MDDKFKKKCFTIYGNQIIVFKNLYNIIGSTIVKSNRVLQGGWGCGYVIIDTKHPAFGNIDLLDVDIHGGITCSKELNEEDFNGIYVNHGWIFGFHTCHSGDSLVNCSKRFVISETLNLANQLEKYGKIF